MQSGYVFFVVLKILKIKAMIIYPHPLFVKSLSDLHLTYPDEGGRTSRWRFTGCQGTWQRAAAFSTSSYGWLQGVRIGIAGCAAPTLHGDTIHGLNGRGVHYGFSFGQLLDGMHGVVMLTLAALQIGNIKVGAFQHTRLKDFRLPHL